MLDPLSPCAPSLAGVVVLDLTRVLAGPYCTKILAQLGARVIKVEMPETGDDSRAFGPFQQGKSLYFAAVNHDKESIALNLKKLEDREILEKLMGLSDVLVENFRPGTMDRLGYSWDKLHTRFPNLIYASTTGFGHTGPDSSKGAYDLVIQGRSGLMSMTGRVGDPPTRVGVSIADLTAGMFLAIGVNAALLKRQRGGGATMIDVAMLDCLVALLEDATTAFMATKEVPLPQGSRHPRIAPFQTFRTRDGHIVITAGNDRIFASLARAIGRPDLLDHPEFHTNDLRHVNMDVLEQEMEKTLLERGTAEWIEVLNAADVPCGPVNTVADLEHDRQVKARRMLPTFHDPDLGDVHVSGNPIKMRDVPETKCRPAPELDRDRASVLAWIEKETAKRAGS